MSLKPRLLLITLVWLATVLVYGYFTVTAKLALPPDGDVYAHTLEFQIFSFVAFKLPGLLCVLVVVVVSQVFLRRTHEGSLSARGKRVMLITFWSLAALAATTLVWALGRPVLYSNPYYWPAEQQVLQLMVTWLPAVAATGIILLRLQHNRLIRTAR